MLCTSDNPNTMTPGYVSPWTNVKTCHNVASGHCGSDPKPWYGWPCYGTSGIWLSGPDCGNSGCGWIEPCPADWNKQSYFFGPHQWDDASFHTNQTVVWSQSAYNMVGAPRENHNVWPHAPLVLPASNTRFRTVVIGKTFKSGIYLDPALLVETPANCAGKPFSRYFGGRCYYYSLLDGGATPARPQLDAIAECSDLGGVLASINTDAEQTFVNGQIAGAGLGCRNNGYSSGRCWIGLIDAGSAFRYVDGTTYHPLFSTGVAVFSPNNACASTRADGTWVGDNCANSYPFICTVTASCNAGWKLLLPYVGYPAYPGLCQQCPAGYYRGYNDPETVCLPCSAGYHGGIEPVCRWWNCGDQTLYLFW